MKSSLWYPTYNLVMTFFLWGRVKCAYTQSDSLNLYNSKIRILSLQSFERVVLIFKVLVLFTASQRATLYVFTQMGADSWAFSWLVCSSSSRGLSPPGCVKNDYIIDTCIQTYSLSSQLKRFMWIWVCSWIPLASYRRLLSATVDSSMLWCFHIYTILKMLLCRTKGICILILLLAHLFELY